MRLRRLVTTVTCLLAGLLLLAIIYCALAPSSHMREVWFIPTWLGVWADRNPTFRNFPVFAALAAMLVFVLSLFPPKHRAESSRRPLGKHFPLQLALGAFLTTALLGVALEYVQPQFRLRPMDPSLLDIAWSVAGAFVGAFGSAYIFKLFAPSLPATSNP